MGIWRSPRTRRRLFWVGALAVAGAVGGLVVALLPNDNPGIDSGAPGSVQIVRTEPQVPMTARRRAAIDALFDRFVPAAVARRNPEAAYALVTPAMRAAATPAQWRAGSIPVPPYDPRGTAFHGWRTVLSYPAQATVELTLEPRKAGEPAVSFMVDVKRIRNRWLVDAVYQRGSYGTPAATSAKAAAKATVTAPRSRPVGGSRGRLGVIWFIVPLALLSLIVIVPTAVFLTGWIADRRVARKYRNSQSRELPPLPRSYQRERTPDA
jgi:hypothetical protein